jgi:formylmethanofuran dehydrogenase subunit E
MESSFEDDWARCAAFHGHECPGLAIGFRAAKAGLEHFSGERAPDEEIVAVVENDACGVDAVQVLTGCTFGKGNLIHLDYGKQVFSFFERESGRSLRLSLRPGALSVDERQRKLMQKDRRGQATEAEVAELLERRKKTIDEILGCPVDDLFDWGEPRHRLPDKAVVQRSERCQRCGELTMPSKMVEGAEGRLCRPCARELEGE